MLIFSDLTPMTLHGFLFRSLMSFSYLQIMYRLLLRTKVGFLLVFFLSFALTFQQQARESFGRRLLKPRLHLLCCRLLRGVQKLLVVLLHRPNMSNWIERLKTKEKTRRVTILKNFPSRIWRTTKAKM